MPSDAASRLPSRCVAWYGARLAAAPLATGAVTAAALGVLGDAAAQRHAARLRRRREEAREEATGEAAANLRGWYDVRRGLASLAFNLLLAAPVYHYAYAWLEELLPVFEDDDDDWTAGGPVAALCQVLVDCVLLDAVFVALMCLSARCLERRGGRAGAAARARDAGLAALGTEGADRGRDRSRLWSAVRAAWKVNVFVLPVEFALFRYCPPRWRLLGVNVIDLFWEAILSFVVHEGGPAASGEEGAGAPAFKPESPPRSPTSTLASSPWSSPSSDRATPPPPPPSLLLVGGPLPPLRPLPRAAGAKQKWS